MSASVQGRKSSRRSRSKKRSASTKNREPRYRKWDKNLAEKLTPQDPYDEDMPVDLKVEEFSEIVPPPIDPRRYQHPLPDDVSNTIQGVHPLPLSPTSVSAGSSTLSAKAVIRYDGALRDFSSKLPEIGAPPTYQFYAHRTHTTTTQSIRYAAFPMPPTLASLPPYSVPPPPMPQLQHQQRQAVQHTQRPPQRHVSQPQTQSGGGRYDQDAVRGKRSSTSQTNVVDDSSPKYVSAGGVPRANSDDLVVTTFKKLPSDPQNAHNFWIDQPNGRQPFYLPVRFPAWSNGERHALKCAAGTIIDQEKFREPVLSLHDIEADDWGKRNVPAVECDEIAATMVDVQDAVWQSFVGRDSYMDEVKKYNASNIEQLKKKRDKARDMGMLARYNDQIRICIANPKCFSATWQMLKMLCEYEDSLDEYVASRRFTTDELEVAKLSQKMHDSLRLITTEAAAADDGDDEQEETTTMSDDGEDSTPQNSSLCDDDEGDDFVVTVDDEDGGDSATAVDSFGHASESISATSLESCCNDTPKSI